MENNIIPVITLKQPWASWVIEELKLIESRVHKNFKTLVGKDFGIHAAQTYDLSDYVLKNPYLSKEKIDTSLSYPTGVILGTVHGAGFLPLKKYHEQSALIECTSVQRYGLRLINAKKFLKPIPCPGELAIWYYDMEKGIKVKKPSDKIQTFF